MAAWRKLGSEEVFWHPLFGLERQLLTSGDQRQEVIVVKAPDWINVIPVLSDGRVVLIRQWRYGIAAPCLEIPGGMVDPDENAEEAAARELLEETGYNARKIKLLGVTHPNPAFLSNQLTTYLATDLDLVEPEREEFGVDDERIVVEPTPMSEIPGLIREGAITHALVIAAFHLLEVEKAL
jgi:8-oxo-dGTP pyrophosphatase MutT (NUDIX family)